MIYFKDLVYLFMPNRCLHCKISIPKNQHFLCLDCNLELDYFPLTDFKNNPIKKLFWGRIDITNACSLYFYHKKTPIQTLLKELKYKQLQTFGEASAQSLCLQLKNSSFFDTINCIIPVPLHPKKEKNRGYNQIELFGTTLAKYFDIPFIKDGLIKTDNNKSQTLQSKDERYLSVQNTYVVNTEHPFEKQHILLVDDVITTGATLTACSKAIEKEFNVNISIITIACVA